MKYEQNDERKSRVKKILGTTATIAAGALMLKETGGLKMISKAFDDIAVTTSRISRDVSKMSRKQLDYEGISGIVKRHILDEDSTYKVAKASKEIKLAEDQGLIASVLRYKNLKNDNTYIKDEMFDAAIRSDIFNKTSKAMKNESKEFFNEMKVLIDEALNKSSSFFDNSPEGYKAVNDEFSKRLEGSVLKDKQDEIVNIMEEALNNSEEIRRNIEKEYVNTLKPKILDEYKSYMLDEYNPEKSKDFFKETLDRAATVNDLLKAAEENNLPIKDRTIFEGAGSQDIIDILKELKEENEDFGKLVVDNATLRVDGNNELYSTHGLKRVKDVLFDEVADTVPGKLFGLRNLVEQKRAPDFMYFGQGSYDSLLSSLSGSKSGFLKYDHFRIGNKTFQYADGTFKHLKEADDFYLISGEHGSANKLLNRITGNIETKKQDNVLLNRLDINTYGDNKVENIKGIFSKFDKDSNWNKNIVKRLLNPDTYGKIDAQSASKFHDDILAINSLFNKATRNPSTKTISSLKDILSQDSINLLNLTESDNIAEELINYNGQFHNKDLTTLVNKYKKYRQDTPNFKQVGSLGNGKGVNVLTYNQMLKREIVKEAMLKDKSKGSYAITYSKLNKLNISGAQKQNLRDLFNWSVLQEEADLYASSSHKSASIHAKVEKLNKVNKIMKGQSSNEQINAFLGDFREGLESFVERNTSALDSVSENKNNVLRANKNNKYVNMRKAVNPLDIIKSVNDEIKFNSKVKQFGKQFVAGRNNLNDLTTATLLPFHMVNRLTTPLESLGLGFSKENTGSAFDLVKAIGLKRILPVAGAIYGISYLDYESRNLTGTSLGGALMNSVSAFGVGTRTIDQAIGLDDKKERSRMYNPLAKYWLGDYKDKDEYLDYLENGYDPVRKGRYWSFGSASEYRGGKISYWEPNKLRQVHSNYKDIAIYGSSEEKWKHSLIPSIRHPFSTVRYLANPYWLEEKHYWDRPYPVTGKMFAEGTPWGAILNPTVGQIIKPQKRMHQQELGGTLTDVRTIIAERNQEIKNRATENRLVRLDQSGFTPMAFAPESMPSLNEAVYSININNGAITDAGFAGQMYSDNMGAVSNVSLPSGNISSPGMPIHNLEKVVNDSQSSSIITSFLPGLFNSGAVNSNVAMKLIGQVNSNIRRGNAIEYKASGIINEKGNLHTAVYQNATNRAKHKMLENSKIENIGSKREFVSDFMYSLNQTSGMYGFLSGMVIPERKGYKLENAGQMTSFSRSFWDSSVGGVGGDFMEIARRFFPHENHNIETINTIKNTMPTWLPQRFHTGDPYTAVPKGEARLPGQGYEALNKLHSDQYGRYGAFDRYKILADIAPNSEEYKIWKKIAKETIKDERLKKEMEQIEYRVKEQTKEHDFYNYKFLTRHLATRNAVIESVTNTGAFKIVGSDEEFQIAGINPLKDEEGNSYVHQYLKAGMQVKLSYEDNKYRIRNNQGKISALVEFGGESITKRMFEEGTGKEKDTKETLADEYFALKGSDIFKGHIFEAIGHAQVPYLHNKFLRIDSPLESYRKEQVYGSPYSTWDHPIEGFIKPVFQEVWGRGPLSQAVGLGTLALSAAASNSDWSKGAKTAAHTLFAMTNPAGFAGGVIGAIPRMSLKSGASRIGWDARNGSYIGAAIGLTGYAFANLENPFLSAGNFAAAGFAVAKQLNYTSKAGKHIGGKEGAMIGAAVGVTLSAIKNPEFSLNKLTEKYIPTDTKKKWEIEEYFDRLEYLKYTNLYHKAAREAKQKEGIDIEKIVNKFEYTRAKNEKKIAKLEKQKAKANLLINENLKEQFISNIDNQIFQLSTPEQYYNLGEYSKSALAYKKAADTTIYGLTNNSSVADVLRALPKYDRDYFLEFAKENDPKARKKILKYVSPYKQKALQVLWGEDTDRQESNYNYFHNHRLPNMFWAGWRPDVDLDHVKMKTIENEGMLLSDFGIYESQKNEPAAVMAPEIRNMNNASNAIAIQRDMVSMLNGLGFVGVDVSVEQTQQSGLQFVTNITRVASYNLQEKVKSALTNIF